MKKKLVKGKDWDSWAWKFKDGRIQRESYMYKPCWVCDESGRWVRIKIVEIEKQP